MRKFAVFDIDGTLIRWQLYHILVDRLAKTNKLGPGVYDHIKEARMRWKKRESADSYHAYEMEIVKGFESALGRLTTQEFDEIIDSIIDEYKDQVYIFTRDLLKSLKSQGYFLLAISGSHHELIEKIAKYYQFDDYKGSDCSVHNGCTDTNRLNFNLFQSAFFTQTCGECKCTR